MLLSATGLRTRQALTLSLPATIMSSNILFLHQWHDFTRQNSHRPTIARKQRPKRCLAARAQYNSADDIQGHSTPLGAPALHPTRKKTCPLAGPKTRCTNVRRQHATTDRSMISDATTTDILRLKNLQAKTHHTAKPNIHMQQRTPVGSPSTLCVVFAHISKCRK